MPLVNVHMAQGRSPDQKKALMAAITDAVVDTLDASPDSVRVWINEVSNLDYMAGRELLADKVRRAGRQPVDRRVDPTDGAADGGTG